MADARRDEQWDHTSFLIAKLHNVNCAKRSDQKEPDHFHPFRQEEKRRRKASDDDDPGIGITALQMFLPKKKRDELRAKRRKAKKT